MSRFRQLFITLIGVGLFVGSAGAEQGQRTNVLVITVDTFRADHLGAYGYKRQTSPHIDSIAARGTLFENAYTTSAWTTPGLISLLTSLDAPTHGVDVRGKSVHPSVITLPEALRMGGYRAPDIFFLTDIPNFHHLGFEPYANRRQYLHQGDEILFRWLQEEAPAEDEPFFLYYHYRDLHQPYDPGEEYEPLYLQEAFGSVYNPVSWARRFLALEKMSLVKREVMLPRGIIDFAPWDKSWVDALYDAQIRRLDEQFFGRLRTVLQETGLVDNTLIVISADHGEELLEHGLVGHVSTFKEGRLVEEMVRIPLIFAGPGVAAGRRVDNRIQVIDAMPTILDLVGLPAAETMQGRSLLPLMRGDLRPERPLFFETTAGGYTASLEHYAQRARAVISGDWKLVAHTPSGESHLFDLSTDPSEDEDQVDDRPALTDSLKALLNIWARESGPLGGGEMVPVQSPSAVGHAPIVIEYPADGDTLRYVGADQTVNLRWTGEAASRYRVLYEVGEGVYHLKGEMDVDSNSPSYGPFHASFWNSVVLYSPFTVRVHPADRADLISAPVTFSLAASDAGGLATAPGRVLISISSFGRDLVTLAAGCVLGLVDLSLWLSQRVSAADVSAWALLLAIAGALVWPRLQRLGEKRVKAWMWLLCYVGIVYSTIPIFPSLWGALRSHTGDSIRHLGTLVVLWVVCWAIYRLHTRVKGRDLVPYGMAFLILCAYVALLIRFGQFPAERLHLLEYGLMAVLVHRALSIDKPLSFASYGIAWGLTVLIGFGDETIQLILPQRFFELKDVGLNAVSAALALGLSRVVKGTADE